jgi:hypothetical protein
VEFFVRCFSREGQQALEGKGFFSGSGSDKKVGAAAWVRRRPAVSRVNANQF